MAICCTTIMSGIYIGAVHICIKFITAFFFPLLFSVSVAVVATCKYDLLCEGA